jgi:hypothetical protein
MTKDIDYFTKAFEDQLKFNKRHAHSNIGYGENVMPVLEIYHSLSDFDEKKSFREALIKWLTDSSREKRELAVDICLGFLIFRDAIGYSGRKDSNSN